MVEKRNEDDDDYNEAVLRIYRLVVMDTMFFQRLMLKLLYEGLCKVKLLVHCYNNLQTRLTIA